MFTRAGLLPSVAHSSAEMMALQNMGGYYDTSAHAQNGWVFCQYGLLLYLHE